MKSKLRRLLYQGALRLQQRQPHPARPRRYRLAVLKLDRLGYAGDYSFEVFNDDYQQLPLDTVAERARRSAVWLHENVLHRSAPLPSWTRRQA